MRSKISLSTTSPVTLSMPPPSWPVRSGCCTSWTSGTTAALLPDPWSDPASPAAVEGETNNVHTFADGSPLDLPSMPHVNAGPTGRMRGCGTP